MSVQDHIRGDLKLNLQEMGAMLKVVVSLFLTYHPLLGIFQAPQWLGWASDILLFVEGDEEIMLSTKYPKILKYKYFNF